MRRAVAVLVLCFLCLLVSSPAFAQAVFGSVFGTVTDPQGAAVPGATVTVTDVTKGTSDTVQTNESGNYSVTHLIPDVYSVTVEAKGFKKFEQKSVPVSADAAARLDAQIQLGSESQTVEVTGEAPQLQTDRADVAVTFNQTYVEDLPVLNRNFTTFELMSPGTQKLVGWSHAATENPQGSQQIFVNGQHFSGTNYQLDGTDNQDPILGIIVVNPNLDAVTETKIALQNYDAEMGKAVAGFVTAQTKSGSNEIHGSAFYFRRSDANQARDPFTQYPGSNANGPAVPSARWQQFGGSVGGPIIKNKLFFFGDFQGTRQVVGTTNQLTVPTAQASSSCIAALGNAAANCDLSQYLSIGQAYNPASSPALDGSGRTPFVNNQIPGNLLSPQAIALLKLFPQPTNGNIKNNYIAQRLWSLQPELVRYAHRLQRIRKDAGVRTLQPRLLQPLRQACRSRFWAALVSVSAVWRAAPSPTISAWRAALPAPSAIRCWRTSASAGSATTRKLIKRSKARIPPRRLAFRARTWAISPPPVGRRSSWTTAKASAIASAISAKAST